MTEEINLTEKTENNECKCFCHSAAFRNFLTIALGTFVGVYFALTLFAALHKPPIVRPFGFGPQGGIRAGCPCKMIHHHHFNKGPQPDVKNFRPDFRTDQPAPFEAQNQNRK